MIRHLCILQSTCLRRWNYHPSPCNLSPSLTEPTAHSDQFLSSHSTIFFPTLPGASESWIFLEFCCVNWLPFWWALLLRGHVSSLFCKVSYLLVRFPTSKFFFWHFLVCCHFFLPFFFFLHIFFCILEFLYCHFRGIWKRREKATCVSSAIFKQMSFQVVCTCVFSFIYSVLFFLFIYVNVFSFCLVVFSQLSISASVSFGLGYWLGWLSVPELGSAPCSFPTPGMTCCPLWAPRFLALGTR